MNSLNFTPNPAVINRRLKRPLSLMEFFGVLLALAMIILYSGFKSYPNIFVDYDIFIDTANNIFDYYYYAYWLLPVFELFSIIPTPVGILIWNTLNILGIWFAARVFGGRGGLTLITYQMLYVLYVGQIVGFVVGCLAFFWWSMANKHYYLAGLGLIIAAGKFQLGGLGGLFLWFLADNLWQDKIRSLVVPMLVAAASLIIYPLWPLVLFEHIQNTSPNNWGSITLWHWVGTWGLLLYFPPLFLPVSREKRLILLVTATALALPYFQHTDLLFLFTLPIGWFTMMGIAGYGLPFWGWAGIQNTVPLLLLLLYAYILLPEINRLRKNNFNQLLKLENQ